MTGRTATARVRTAHLVVASMLLGVSLLVTMGWIASRVWDATRALQSAAEHGNAAVAAVADGDIASARVSLLHLADAAAHAGDVADDATWAVAAAMPMLGDDVAAVGVVAHAARTLAQTLVSPAATMLASEGGDAAAFARWEPALAGATGGVAEARHELGALDTTTLLSPVARAVDQLRDILEQTAPVLDTAHAGAAVSRAVSARATSVLVLMQNGAELRTGGGITGAFALLRVEDGSISLEAQADSTAFEARRDPIRAVSDAQTSLYGDVVGRFVQNASMPADFAETAELASAWWQGIGHPAPDLVASVDVPTVGALLGVVGPVRLPDGSELTDANIVQRLLVDPYLSLDSEGQTELMQSAVTAAVAELSASQIDPMRLLSALATPIAEGRLSLWSADPAVQQLLQRSALGGPSARVAAAGQDAFAVFLNDGTGGKMDVFLHVDIDATAALCRDDGLAEVVVRLTMSSSAPEDAEYVLPGDVTGRGMFGTGAGDIGTSVAVSAPPGSYFGGVTKDGERALSVDVEDEGRPTSLVRVNLSPAEVNIVEFHFTMGTRGPVTPTIVHTPLLNAPTITVGEGACS